jgi:signal transduction histidine kinase
MDSTTLSRSSSQPLWLPLARIFQVGMICLTVGLFIISLPINYEQRSIVCKAEPCPPGQLTTASVQALERIGVSVDSYVTISIALDILTAAAYTICAIVIFIRKPNDLLTIFVSVMLVTFGVATFTGGIRDFIFVYPQLNWLFKTISLIGNYAILAFFFVFPNGRFTPRWTTFILVIYALAQLLRYFFPASPLNLQTTSPFLYNAVFLGANLSGMAAQIYRYRRVSNLIEQQQTKWVVYGLSIGVCGYIIAGLISFTVPNAMGSGFPIVIGLNILGILFMLLFPLSISIAVLRYRLWDINPIINRTLVYGALSASTIGLYVFAVGYFSSFFQNNKASVIISFIATGVIAFLFEPLREGLQRVVNRLMYGERDDPATVLTRLSARLDSTLALDSILPTIVETVAQTLRLPYAAITLNSRNVEPRIIATYGLPQIELIHLPLNYQTEQVGELLLAPRAAGESFSASDMNLLNIIAQQAGVAAHTVRLTEELQQLNADLQQSRERLVTAQEEERRRLRRDLHDGVGPTLASLSQRIDTAADFVERDPEVSVRLLKELKGQVKSTVAEIRRLVYALRPPVLDEFGLVSAIREHVAPYMGPNGLQITFEVPEPMPPLPAAVEVAAYRIVLEAFTNVIHHAEASQCTIKIKLDDNSLLLEVSDDGKGLSSKAHSGIGFTSMHERASELGGECLIEDTSRGGTRVSARLPIVSLGYSLASNDLPLETRSQVPDSEIKD